MLGGGTFGVNSDDPYWLFKVDQASLTSRLDAAGLSWRGYYEGMPYAGYRGYCYPVRCLGVPDSDTLYIAKHNGVVYFHSVNGSRAELTKMRPLGALTRALHSGRVPNFNYIMPDECHDMHGAPPVCVDSGNPRDAADNTLVSAADAFVARTVAEITRARVWKQGNDAIVINFDEGDNNAGCCGTKPGGGRALAIVITNHGRRRVSDPTPYNHYSLLASFERAFGLRCLAGACNAGQGVKPMTPLFAVAPHAQARPVPTVLFTAQRHPNPNGPVGPQPQVKSVPPWTSPASPDTSALSSQA